MKKQGFPWENPVFMRFYTAYKNTGSFAKVGGRLAPSSEGGDKC